MDDYPLINPARILPTYVGDNQVSPFHYCYANKKTIFRLAAGRFYAHHNGENVTSSYWALRKHAAFFDVPERPVEIVGIDAVSFVEHIVARKIADMKIGRGRYVILCTHQGGIFMDGILFRLAKNKFWLVHPDADLDTWLLANKNGFDVTFTDPKSRVLQLQGPKSFQIMNDVTNGVLDEAFGYFHFGLFKVDGQEIYVSRTGWTGELGYEIYTLGEQTDCERLWHHVMSKGKYHGMVFSSMLAMNIRRIEAGILDSGSDFNCLMTPSEVGLERFVDLRKKDFIGRKALEITNPGNRLFGLSCAGFSPNANDLVLSDEAVVGKVTTGAFSPYLKLGIGYVRFEKPSDWADKTLTLKSHRSGAVPCKIVDLPFYDQEKLLPRQINFNRKSS